MPIPIIPIAVAAGLAHTFYGADKSMKMDERALSKYAKAFEKSAEAARMVHEKEKLADKRLNNVVRKKRAVIENSFPLFAEVYEVIQKVILKDSANAYHDLTIWKEGELAQVNSMALSVRKDFTDKELVCGVLTKGIGGMMIKQSEAYLSAANNQMRAANVASSQAESICLVYDALIEKADRVANVIAQLNTLFVKSIKETQRVIQMNEESNRSYHEYSVFDKEVLVNCANFAKGMSEVVKVPVITEKGEITVGAEELIRKGEERIMQMNHLISK